MDVGSGCRSQGKDHHAFIVVSRQSDDDPAYSEAPFAGRAGRRYPICRCTYTGTIKEIIVKSGEVVKKSTIPFKMKMKKAEVEHSLTGN